MATRKQDKYERAALALIPGNVLGADIDHLDQQIDKCVRMRKGFLDDLCAAEEQSISAPTMQERKAALDVIAGLELEDRERLTETAYRIGVEVGRRLVGGALWQ